MRTGMTRETLRPDITNAPKHIAQEGNGIYPAAQHPTESLTEALAISIDSTASEAENRSLGALNTRVGEESAARASIGNRANNTGKVTKSEAPATCIGYENFLLPTSQIRTAKTKTLVETDGARHHAAESQLDGTDIGGGIALATARELILNDIPFGMRQEIGDYAKDCLLAEALVVITKKQEISRRVKKSGVAVAAETKLRHGEENDIGTRKRRHESGRVRNALATNQITHISQGRQQNRLYSTEAGKRGADENLEGKHH